MRTPSIKKIKLFNELMIEMASWVNCEFYWKLDEDRSGDWSKGIICLNPVVLLQGDDKAWSSFFHEFTHAKCSLVGPYKKFHNTFHRNRKYRNRMELKVERAVELEAAKLLAIYFPDFEYDFVYKRRINENF